MEPTTQQPQEIDRSVVNLLKGIKHQESGGDYNKSGASGEYGAYQYLPETFKDYSTRYANNPNADITNPEDQDKVAYTTVKAWKDKGYTPEQVLSMWNAGEGKPDAYAQDHRGTNAQGVQYDVPKYVDNIKTYLTETKTAPSIPSSPKLEPQAPKEDTLGQELSQRVGDIGKSVSTLIGGKSATGEHRISGLIQTAGALGGAVGDVVNKGLELIPGVKQVEGLIGKGVGKFMQTEVGQSVGRELSDFSQKHPELSKDIGAGFNIVTAIPILRGIGVVKDVALDGVSMALKRKAENVVTKDITQAAERTIAGRNMLKNNPEAVKTLVDERAMPDIVDGKYSTKEAYGKLSQDISTIEDTKLQPALQQASTKLVADRQPLEQVRKEALADIKKQFKTSGQVSKAEAEVNRIFDDYKASYGDYVTLEDINGMKRGIRKSINFNSPKLETDVTYHIGQTFQKSIEEGAKKLGLDDINAINAEMARLIKAQNMLRVIEGKPVKMGFTSGVIKNAFTMGGEAAGNATGIPIAGALFGRGVGESVGKRLLGGTQGILKRTGKNAIRQSAQDVAKRSKGLLKGALLQKAAK